MPEARAILRNTKAAAKIETTEGTPIAEDAAASYLMHIDGFAPNLDRDLIENDLMTGSLSAFKPSAGMWSDDLGFAVQLLLRGKGTLSQPEWSVFLNSILGDQGENTDGVCDTGCTTTVIQVKSGAGDLDDGQLIFFPTQGEVRQVTDETGAAVTIRPPLSSAPSEDDTFIAGITWTPTSEDQPSFTSYHYFDGPKRLRYAGAKCVTAQFAFEVGSNVPVLFTNRALEPTYDNVAQAVTPTLDTDTVPLRCLGVDMYTRMSATAKGVPTQTETIIEAPPFDVAVGDLIEIDVGSSVWETVAISNVSGDAGSDITLTHASVSVAASATDTVYIQRIDCAEIGDTVEILLEIESDFEKCMAATYGKTAQEFIKRTISFNTTPYFKSWGSFLMRDDVTDMLVQITLGTLSSEGLTNIVSFMIPAKINTEVTINAEPLMKLGVNGRATRDSTLGNDSEISIGAF